MVSAYQQLEARFRELHVLNGILAQLHWDTATMLPSGSADERAEQQAWLEGTCHAKLVDAQLADWLGQAETDQNSLDEWQQANLREIRHAYVHATAVPQDLVEALTRAGMKCEQVWRTARKESNFKAFAPYLREVVHLVRQKAQAKAEALGLTRYDAMMDSYDAGRRMVEVDSLFGQLQAFLPDFIEKVRTKDEPAELPMPVKQQRELALRLMKENPVYAPLRGNEYKFSNQLRHLTRNTFKFLESPHSAKPK